MARTRVKICGITEEEGLFAAAESGADAVGFVFHAKSRRFIEPEDALELTMFLPPFVSTVGLLVNPTVKQVRAVEEVCAPTWTQFHGQESEDIVRECGPGIIKAIQFDAATIEQQLKRWNQVDEVDAILVDGSAGGEGQSFDWAKLSAVADDITKPLILAGGLTPENVGEAIRIVRPFGVDVSSGVERAPGEKDAELIEAFCRAVQRADLELE